MLANSECNMDSSNVWTIASVISLTCLVVSQIKMWLGNVPILRAVPLIVVAIGVACGLTGLAVGAGYLSGSLPQLMAQTVLAALGSGGLYNVLSGSALQRLDITKTAPITTGTNAVRLDEVNQYVDATGGELHDRVAVMHLPPDDGSRVLSHSGPEHTPQWPAALLFVLFSLTFVVSGCNLLMNKPIDATSPQGRLFQAKQDYLSVLEFFTFLRDQHVVTQRWMNEQQPMFDAAQSALKIWSSVAPGRQRPGSGECRTEVPERGQRVAHPAGAIRERAQYTPRSESGRV
jgi:hypothetical protein